MVKTFDRRELLFGGIMLGTAGVAMVAKPVPVPPPGDVAAFERAVPLRVGPYRYASAAGVVVPQRDELSTLLYDRYLARTYVARDRPAVMLLVAYGSTQDYGLQVHRPESCYPAWGYAIGGSSRVPLHLGQRVIEATTLTATRPDRHERLLYWTRIGADFPADLWSERGAILRETLSRRRADGVIVRLSTLLDDDAAATALLTAFNAALVAGLGEIGRRLLLGVA